MSYKYKAGNSKVNYLTKKDGLRSITKSVCNIPRYEPIPKPKADHSVFERRSGLGGGRYWMLSDEKRVSDAENEIKEIKSADTNIFRKLAFIISFLKF